MRGNAGGRNLLKLGIFDFYISQSLQYERIRLVRSSVNFNFVS